LGSLSASPSIQYEILVFNNYCLIVSKNGSFDQLTM
jgi:hypothetical protein